MNNKAQTMIVNFIPGQIFLTTCVWWLIAGLAESQRSFSWSLAKEQLIGRQLLSIPYLLISIPVLFRSEISSSFRRRSASFTTLFRLRQIDFFAQIAIPAGATLITIHHQRPLQESLLIAYPLLAAVQTLSSLSCCFFWRDYAPWRSIIRIPYMVLQALLIIGTCVRISESGRFSWASLLEQPAAQILVASYFLITYLEWETLDRTSPA